MAIVAVQNMLERLATFYLVRSNARLGLGITLRSGFSSGGVFCD